MDNVTELFLYPVRGLCRISYLFSNSFVVPLIALKQTSYWASLVGSQAQQSEFEIYPVFQRPLFIDDIDY